jgi:hypothetical protein
MERLEAFNERVREWADKQPPVYRKSARAFGYRCNVETSSFSGTLQWVSTLSRRYGYGVSRATLVRHLKVFQAHGVITVKGQRVGKENRGSIYTVDFDAVVPVIAEDSRPEQSGKVRNLTNTHQPARDSKPAVDDYEDEPYCCQQCQAGYPDLCVRAYRREHGF